MVISLGLALSVILIILVAASFACSYFYRLGASETSEHWKWRCNVFAADVEFVGRWCAKVGEHDAAAECTSIARRLRGTELQEELAEMVDAFAKKGGV